MIRFQLHNIAREKEVSTKHRLRLNAECAASSILHSCLCTPPPVLNNFWIYSSLFIL
eukprot:m.39569 g.39569  ORF g.39569 m.39569 type:complete len:57 (-) comp6873_c0_seq1:233-403(-)